MRPFVRFLWGAALGLGLAACAATPSPTPTATSTPPATPTASPSPTPAGYGSRIAFAAGVGRDPDDIYTMNPDGTDVRQLTSNDVPDDQPHWSPDGSRIAWVSGIGDKAAIYVMNADGSGKTRLTGDNNFEELPFRVDIAWAPDGSEIAYTTETYSDIPNLASRVHVVDLTSGSDVRVAQGGLLGWSTDGRSILVVRRLPSDATFMSDTALIVSLNLETGAETRLASAGSFEAWRLGVGAAWRPGHGAQGGAQGSAQQIAYAGAPYPIDPAHPSGFYLAGPDGGSLQQIGPSMGGFVTQLKWSASGNTLAFVMRLLDYPETSTLYLADLSGHGPPASLGTIQTADPKAPDAYYQDWISVSPDGRQIVYAAPSGDSSGKSMLFMADAGRPGQPHRPIREGSTPDWSSGGVGGPGAPGAPGVPLDTIAAAFPSPTPLPPGPLIIHNHTGLDICYLWVRAAGAPTWGSAYADNVNFLATDASLTIPQAPARRVDIQAEDCGHNILAAMFDTALPAFGSDPAEVSIAGSLASVTIDNRSRYSLCAIYLGHQPDGTWTNNVLDTAWSNPVQGIVIVVPPGPLSLGAQVCSTGRILEYPRQSISSAAIWTITDAMIGR